MENLTRIDDTLVHKALREAFVNAIVHGDYNSHQKRIYLVVEILNQEILKYKQY